MENYIIKKQELKEFLDNEDINLNKICFFIAPKDFDDFEKFILLAKRKSFLKVFKYLAKNGNDFLLLKSYFNEKTELEIYYIILNSNNAIIYGTKNEFKNNKEIFQ